MQHDDDRSMIAKAWGWGYQVTAISFEMVLPSLLGLWVDRLLGTMPLFLVLGAVVGMVGGLIHLIRFAKRIGKHGEKRSRRD